MKTDQEDLDGAIADYNKVIELKGDYFKAFSNRAWCELLKGNFDGAIGDATRAIELQPKDGNAYSNRGWSLYAKGNIAGALEDCKRAVELEGANSPDAAADRGMVDFINGEFDNAAGEWKKAILYNPSSRKLLEPWIEKAKAAGKKSAVTTSH